MDKVSTRYSSITELLDDEDSEVGQRISAAAEKAVRKSGIADGADPWVKDTIIKMFKSLSFWSVIGIALAAFLGETMAYIEEKSGCYWYDPSDSNNYGKLQGCDLYYRKNQSDCVCAPTTFDQTVTDNSMIGTACTNFGRTNEYIWRYPVCFNAEYHVPSSITKRSGKKESFSVCAGNGDRQIPCMTKDGKPQIMYSYYHVNFWDAMNKVIQEPAKQLRQTLILLIVLGTVVFVAAIIIAAVFKK